MGAPGPGGHGKKPLRGSAARGSARFWDRVARRFAAARIRDVASYERRLAAIEARLTPGMRLLDLASGSGLLAVRLAPQVRQVDALDISSKMVAIAQARAAEARIFNVRFTCAAIEELAQPAFRYDMVLAMSVLHLLDDWRGAIAKAHGLLRPGGLFVSNTYCIGGEGKWLKALVRLGAPLGLMPNLQAFGKEALLSALGDAGFVIEEDWQKAPQKPVFVLARKPG